MDTTETYIKMCEKVEEIQAFWNEVDRPKDYFIIWCKVHSVYFIRDYNDEWCHLGLGEFCKPSDFVFLPRQDQLQEMLPNFLDGETTYVDKLIRAIIDDFYKLEKFKSWNQFWLAFVMRAMYNKIWVDGDWVEEKVEAVK